MPAKTYRFTITGTGTAPFDMFRYDRCWPRTEQDAGSLSSLDRAPRNMPRVIEMEGLRQPTIARWASFGWEATNA